MIREINIENYKALKKINLFFEKYNIFTGDNNSGKTSCLEKISCFCEENKKNFIFLNLLNDDFEFVQKEIGQYKDKLIELLNFLIEDIKIKEEIYIKFKNEDIFIPINMIGKGSLKIIKITLAILGKYQLVFIDNLEGIHYLLYRNLSDIITNSKNQIFIVTHSKEFIEEFCYSLRDKNEEVRLYRFEKLRENKLKIKNYSREEVLETINEGWEVR